MQKNKKILLLSVFALMVLFNIISILPKGLADTFISGGYFRATYVQDYGVQKCGAPLNGNANYLRKENATVNNNFRNSLNELNLTSCNTNVSNLGVYNATNSFNSGLFTDGGWEQGSGEAEESVTDCAISILHDNCLKMESNTTPYNPDGWSNYVLQKNIVNTGNWFNFSFWVLKTSIGSSFWLIRFLYNNVEYCQIGSWKQFVTIRDPSVHDVTTGISANYWCYFDLKLNFATNQFYYQIIEFTPTPAILCTGVVTTGNMPQIDKITLGVSDATSDVYHYVDGIDDSTDSQYYWRRNYDSITTYTYTIIETQLTHFSSNPIDSLLRDNLYTIQEYNFEYRENIERIRIVLKYVSGNTTWILIYLDIYSDYLEIAQVRYNAVEEYNSGFVAYDMDYLFNETLELNVHTRIISQYVSQNMVELRYNGDNLQNQTINLPISQLHSGNTQYYFQENLNEILVTATEDSFINPFVMFKQLISPYPYAQPMATSPVFIGMGFVSDIIAYQQILPLPVDPNANRPYWEQHNWELTFDSMETVFIGDTNFNFTYDFAHSQIEEKIINYYYDDFRGKSSDWGDWTWAFNWLRDGLHYVLSSIWVGIQFLGCLCVNFVTYCLGWLGCALIFILWDVLVFWLFFALCQVAWALVTVLMYSPLILSALLYIMAIVIAGIIWGLSFGTLDFNTVLNQINSVLQYIGNYVVELVDVFITNIDAFALFAIYYMILIGFIYFKVIYTKARGYTNRSAKLADSLEAYLAPVRFTIGLVSKIKDLVSPFS